MEMDPVLHMRFLSWATRLMIDAAKQMPQAEYEKDRGSSYGGIKGTMEHIFRADSVWFSRVAGKPFAKITDVPVPDTLDELAREWLTLLERFQERVAQLTPAQITYEVGYANSQGVEYRTQIWQIVLHLVNHSSYHRGQVITMMRQAGATPPGTDLIMFYRSLEKQSATTPR